MTRHSVGWTQTALTLAAALGASVLGAQSPFDVGATIGAGSFHSYSTDRGVVLGASVGLRLGPTLTLAPQVSYWTDSDNSFLVVGPELRWAPSEPGRTSMLVGIGIGSESMDYLTLADGPYAGGGTEYLKSVVATFGAEYLLMPTAAVQPLLHARLAMGIATLEDEHSGSYDRGLLFTVGLGVRFGKR